jgi:hypothetical protein
MMQSLGWVVLFLGLMNVLAATLLFPLIRRLNAWSFALYTRIAEQGGMPFADLAKQLGGWWLAREGLQRVVSLATGLVLLIVWWFVWGPGAA